MRLICKTGLNETVTRAATWLCRPLLRRVISDRRRTEPLRMSERRQGFKGEELCCDNIDVILPKCKQLPGVGGGWMMDGKTKPKEIIVFQPLAKSCYGDVPWQLSSRAP